MGLIYAIVFAVITWLALWALGWKAIDSTLIAAGIILVSVGVYRVLSYLPGNRTAGSDS